MKKVTLVITEDLANALGITNASDDTAIAGAILTACNRAKLADEFKNKYEKELEAKTKAESDLTTYKAEQDKDKCKNMLDAAQEGGKLTNELRAVLEEDYTDPVKLDAVLNKMGAQPRIKNELNEGGSKDRDTATLKAEFEKLDKSGELANVAKNEPERYKRLYTARYGKEPKNVPGSK